MGNNLQQTVKSVFNRSEADKHAKETYLREFLANELMSRNKDTAQSLRAPADKLDQVRRDCEKIHVVGTSAGITGGILIIAGGIASKMTFTAATPFLALGIGAAVAAAGTNLATSFVEASIYSKEIKKAVDLKEALNNVNDVNDTKQKFLDGKEYARLLFIVYLIDQIGELNDPVKKLLQQFVLRAFNLPSNIVREVSRGIEKVEVQAGPQGARLAAGARKAVLTGAQVARRARAQVIRQTGAQRATARRAGAQLARLVGAQAAGDIPQTSARGVGRLIIGLNVAFLVWDAIDLGLTITSIIENRGSETAKVLRQKADGLEQSY